MTLEQKFDRAVQTLQDIAQHGAHKENGGMDEFSMSSGFLECKFAAITALEQFRRTDGPQKSEDKPYRKTAKDLAFDRERTKLQGEILKVRKSLSAMTAELAAANETIEEQKKAIVRLNETIERAVSVMDLSREDLNTLLSDAKNRASLAHMYERMSRMGLGGYGFGL